MARTKHTPLIRLQATRLTLDAAQQECPHWDHEGHHGDGECCLALLEAKRAHRAALRAYQANR